MSNMVLTCLDLLISTIFTDFPVATIFFAAIFSIWAIHRPSRTSQTRAGGAMVFKTASRRAVSQMEIEEKTNRRWITGIPNLGIQESFLKFE